MASIGWLWSLKGRLAEAERLCGRITILNDGRVVAEDTPGGLIALTAKRLVRSATLQDVFMTYTGSALDDVRDEDEFEELTEVTTMPVTHVAEELTK